MNKNLLEQPLYGHELNRLERTAAHAHNIRLKEIFKKGALSG